MMMLGKWLTGADIPRLGIITVCGFSSTSAMNPLCALLFIRPYREAVKEFFMGKQVAPIISPFLETTAFWPTHT